MEFKSSVDYQERIDQLVGDRNPHDILSSTLAQFHQLLAGLEEEKARAVPVGSWSVNDVLQHLVDAEMVNGYRLRMALSSYRPQLPGFNQDYWVERFNTDRTLSKILADWEMLRAYNLRLIQSINGDELNKEYVHEERGVETVYDLLHLIAGHDLIHLQQVKRLLNS